MISADVPPQAPQVQVQQVQQKSAAQVKPSIDMVRNNRAYKPHLKVVKPNGRKKTFKRNKRYQLKHGFKAKRNR